MLRSRPCGSMNSWGGSGSNPKTVRKNAISSLSWSGETEMTRWSSPVSSPAPVLAVGSKSPCQWSRWPGVSLTNTCSPEGEVIPGSIASPAPRAVSTSGHSRALARSATAATGRAATPSAAA